MNRTIETILKPFELFGVNLGLQRIQRLLADLDNPQETVPIVHVAGTNGKGSVCAYLSAVLTEAGYRVGRYTSPHLMDWTELIYLNEQPIAVEELLSVLQRVNDAIEPLAPCPTQFEVITAAAWLYFAKQRVDVAVIEVGLGGRLDATNVCDRPLVAIVTSIGWDHWQCLGPTLGDIAREKAGIFKPNCPVICGAMPLEAHTVMKQQIAQLGCPAIFPESARMLENASTVAQSEFLTPTARDEIQDLRKDTMDGGKHRGIAPTNHQARTFCVSPEINRWAVYDGIEYPLPLLGDVQLTNSALAIAALQVLRSQGWQISDQQIAQGMAKTRWPGRLQWVNWQYEYNERTKRILVDGAHNAAAANVLRQYVDTLSPQSVSWTIGMLSGKDRVGIFQALLRPGDRLYLVPVPDWNSAEPETLRELAYQLCPELTEICCDRDLAIALAKATANPNSVTVLCGSLYLLGHFFTTQRNKTYP